MTSFTYLNIDPNLPVLFLDIDGVLNGGWQHELLRPIGFYTHATDMGDYVLLSKLETLIGISVATNAQWVIVSSWVRNRLSEDDEEIVQLMNDLGYDTIKGSLITSGGQERGDSVMACIKALGLTRYAVVDDAKLQMYKNVHDQLGKHFIAPNGRYGLQDGEFESIYDLLMDSKPLSGDLSSKRVSSIA